MQLISNSPKSKRLAPLTEIFVDNELLWSPCLWKLEPSFKQHLTGELVTYKRVPSCEYTGVHSLSLGVWNTLGLLLTIVTRHILKKPIFYKY